MNDDATQPFKPTRDDDPLDDSYEWDYEEERTSPGILWGRVIAFATMLFLAFVVGRASAPSGVPDDEVQRLQNRLAVSQDEVARLQTQLEDESKAEPSPNASPTSSPTGEEDNQDDGATLVYTVKAGDNFRELAERFYQDATLDDYLADANGMSLTDPLEVGQELQIPPEPEE